MHWDEAGRTIIIENPIRLAKELCPKVWQQKDMASFTRQMNVSLVYFPISCIPLPFSNSL